MCTVSWRRTGADYDLLFNRDESRLRGRALAPKNCVSYLAPQDADAGGSWIVVNRHGLTLCLLNYYGFSPTTERAWTSRGELVLRYADCDSVAAVAAALVSFNAESFRGFRLLAVDGESAEVHTWDGHRLASEAVSEMLSSSAFEQGAVIRKRQSRYQALRLSEASSVQALTAFQQDHASGPSAWSVCMHRDDACTVSLTHVSVDKNRVRMRYADGPPCETPLAEGLELKRV